MFFVYWLQFAAILIAIVFFGSFWGDTALYIVGFLLLAAVLAALATIVTKLGDLEEKLDKLLEKKKDEHEE